MDFSALLTPDNLVALLTLTAMEIVLGIDNIVFISILVAKLPAERQDFARRTGLLLALGMRLGLLFSISWVMGLTKPLFELFDHEITGKSLILLGGGLFLVGKATHEIYEKLEVEHHHTGKAIASGTLGMILFQIIMLDIVFSLDSVITAVGMAKELSVMVVAMVVAVGVMLAFAGPIGNFVNRHPSMKILALSFLILIGVMLAAEGLGQHVGKGYIYSAMGFSLLVEMINMRVRAKRQAPVTLHNRFEAKHGGSVLPEPPSPGAPAAG